MKDITRKCQAAAQLSQCVVNLCVHASPRQRATAAPTCLSSASRKTGHATRRDEVAWLLHCSATKTTTAPKRLSDVTCCPASAQTDSVMSPFEAPPPNANITHALADGASHIYIYIYIYIYIIRELNGSGCVRRSQLDLHMRCENVLQLPLRSIAHPPGRGGPWLAEVSQAALGVQSIEGGRAPNSSF
jgi:hypothetical protein